MAPAMIGYFGYARNRVTQKTLKNWPRRVTKITDVTGRVTSRVEDILTTIIGVSVGLRCLTHRNPSNSCDQFPHQRAAGRAGQVLG
jgi:hypothetical protein